MHDSVRAALIYLRTTAGRQRAIADQMGKNAETALGETKRSGTRKARGQGASEKRKRAGQDSNPRPAA